MTRQLQTEARESGWDRARSCLRWGQPPSVCVLFISDHMPGRAAVQFQALVFFVEMFSEPWHELRVLDSALRSLYLQLLYILYIFVQRHLGTSPQPITFIEM